MKRFLFVDNDMEFTTSLINIVMARHPDFEYIQSKNTHDAINNLIFGKFDYVFVDYYLEKETSVKLIRRISGKFISPERLFIISGIDPDDIDGELGSIQGLYNKFIVKTEFIDEFNKLFGGENGREKMVEE